jgi:hypothetical protein
VRPADGARKGSAVESVDFSEAISDGEADVQSVVRGSRVHEVLEEVDRELIALASTGCANRWACSPSAPPCT